jgi:hypothetical protein
MKPSLRARLLAVLVVVIPLLLATHGLAGMRGVRFSHSLHVEENGIECLDCHPNAVIEEAGDEILMPAKGTCVNCHDVEDQSSCSMCHLSGEEPPQCSIGDACKEFSHEKHTRERPECSTCHKGIECTENTREAFRPEMTICSDCHQKHRLKPPSHLLAWEHTHGRHAEVETQSCDLCHVDLNDCNTCHNGDNLTESTPHPLAYLYSHGPDARLGRSRCETCHSEQLFCNDCHSSYQVQPLSHDLAGWGRGNHGFEATRHIEQCMRCHSESEAEETCGSCHH